MSQVKAAIDLLPYPFCGGDPVTDHSEDLDTDFIRCDCGAAHWGEPEDWNHRAQLQPGRTQ